MGRPWWWLLVLAASCGGAGVPGGPGDADVPDVAAAWEEGAGVPDAPPGDRGEDPGRWDPGGPDSEGFDRATENPGSDGFPDEAGADGFREDAGPDGFPEDASAGDLGGMDPTAGDPGGEDFGEDSGGMDLALPDVTVSDPGVPDPGGGDPGSGDPGPGDPGGDLPPEPSCPRLLPLPDPAWPSGPRSNPWSWNGSWTPRAEDFPLQGLFDDQYFDGHRVEGRPTPILPPGRWDWNDADNDLANWRNFYTNLGEFLPLRDGCDRQFGWRFLPKYPEAVDFSGPGEYFEGSSGMDLLLLGPGGNLSSITGSLGGGPDVLVFGHAWSLDYRTGETGVPGADRDDDLVVAGCIGDAGLDYPIRTMTIHAGPGADVLFARNIRAAALDAGNGAGGRTDTLDPTDGDDWVILGGNVKDVRVFGGYGNDVLFWYVDQMNEATPYQGGDFFGGGGYGGAVFGDPGIDRLVLVAPPETRIVDRPSSPPQPGSVLVMRENGGSDEPWYDEPTLNDPYARYCITCGRGPNGERTLYVQYASADGRIDTGYVSVTAFEELQVGTGPGARVYRLDQVAGRAVAAPDLAPLEAPAHPFEWCALR